MSRLRLLVRWAVDTVRGYPYTDLAVFVVVVVLWTAGPDRWGILVGIVLLAMLLMITELEHARKKL